VNYSYCLTVLKNDVTLEMDRVLSENRKYHRMVRNSDRYLRARQSRKWENYFDNISHELWARHYDLDCQARCIRTATYHTVEKAIQNRRYEEMAEEGKITAVTPFLVAYTGDDKRLLACTLVAVADIAGVKYAVRVTGNKAFTTRGDAPIRYKKDELIGMEFTIDVGRLARV
jgi:hypothetical protein